MFKPAFAAATIVVLLGAFMFAAIAPAADEGELLRQIKSDVFDQRWDAVLAGCTQFISQFGRSSDVSRAYYYRAQALEHGKGREEEAIAAYTDYLTRFPGDAGAMKEDALLSRMTLASSLYLKGNKKHVGMILDGMTNEKGYPGIFAAIQASKIDHAPARAKALSILLRCAGSEADAELRNECLLGVLRIDPQKAKEVQAQPPPPPAKTDGRPTPPTPPGEKAKLIRVEVFNKLKKQVEVRVNMPLAFAEMLLDSLGPEEREAISNEMVKKGIRLEKLLESIKKFKMQTIVEIDNDEHHIRVWVE